MADAGALAPVVPFDDPSRKRRLVKIAAWIAGTCVVLVVLNILGVDVTGWISDLWKQIKAVPPGYIVAALAFQTGQTIFCGLSYYGILSAAYPGEVTPRADRDRVRRRGGDEQLPAGEHRHLRDAADVRRADPELQRRAVRSPPTSSRRSSSRSPARSSTCTSSSRSRARSTSTSGTSRLTPCSRSPSSSAAIFLIVVARPDLLEAGEEALGAGEEGRRDPLRRPGAT